MPLKSSHKKPRARAPWLFAFLAPASQALLARQKSSECELGNNATIGLEATLPICHAYRPNSPKPLAQGPEIARVDKDDRQA